MTMFGRSESKIKITREVRRILLDNVEIKALISEKIFPLYARENTNGDYILYTRDEYSIDYTKMGPLSQVCRIFINVISDDYDRGQDIAELVLSTLEGDHSNGLRIRLEDSTEDTTDKKYIQVLLFKISNS